MIHPRQKHITTNQKEKKKESIHPARKTYLPQCRKKAVTFLTGTKRNTIRARTSAEIKDMGFFTGTLHPAHGEKIVLLSQSRGRDGRNLQMVRLKGRKKTKRKETYRA
jgi:hypothetical protein